MIDSSSYTIGWICALITELVAAQSMLDEKYEDEYERAPNDNNTYTFGKISKHNVVIAALPCGEYGTSSAASVARDLVRSFKNVRIALMVGIGGGTPRPGQDIRLGDVVLSAPAHGRGGVCQYDFVKAIQDRDFLRTGHLNQAPAFVLSAITALMADIEIHGHDLDNIVEAALINTPRLRKKYARPDAATDRLYRSTFVRSHDDHSSASTCTSEDQLIPRDDRPESDLVEIHRGLIASGNTLVKDALFRDRLAEELGILCFETEAAGLMNQFPTLAIRGICDYADSHKNKEWQGYAAMTAAAFAKKLLTRLAPDRVETEARLSELKELREEVGKISDQVHGLVQDAGQRHINERQRKLEEWLAAPDPSTNHIYATELRHANSGDWIFTTANFVAWKNLETRLLWLHGLSGCGKTILASTVIEHLRKETEMAQGAVILYFYFDTQDSRKQKLLDVLRSLIQQLCHAKPTNWTKLNEIYASYKKRQSQCSLSVMKSCFENMCTGQPITIILDALDESSREGNDRADILTWVLQATNRGQAQMLVTSRSEHDIHLAFAKAGPHHQALELHSSLTNKDIRALLHARIYSLDGELSRWQARPDVQRRIENTLAEKADGMYRWVVCQLDVLKHCIDEEDLDSALRSLPAGLNETYDRIIGNIAEGKRQKALRILQFLTYSSSPLQLDEMIDAIAVRLDTEPAFREDYRLPVKTEILSCCGSLTRLVERKLYRGTSTEIQLAHASVKEYLLLGRAENAFAGHLQEMIAKCCMVQVSLAYLHEASQRPRSLPFERFAGECWAKHAKVVERVGGPVFESILRMFTSEALYSCWLKKRRIGDPSTVWRDWPHSIYTAAALGLTVTVRALLVRGATVNPIDSPLDAPLNAAVLNGRFEMTKLLLEAGADVNAYENAGYVGLVHYADMYGNFDIMRLIIEHGANFETQIFEHTYLARAIFRKDPAMADFLLRHGATLNASSKEYGSALSAAVMSGSIDMVQMLLDRPGVDVNMGREHGYTALTLAAGRGLTGIVRLLLSRGADVSVTDEDRGNALCEVLIAITVVESTSDDDFHGLNGAQSDQNGTHSDQNGAGSGQNGERSMQDILHVVELLIDAGADVNARGSEHGSPLEIALRKTLFEVAWLLIDRGADLTTVKYDQSEALQSALSAGDVELVKSLIVQLAGDQYLHCAASGDSSSNVA